MSGDRFKIDGLCWCPGDRSLAHYRAMGHTEDCTHARKGWEANRRDLSQNARERAEMEQVGRALVADSKALLDKGET